MKRLLFDTNIYGELVIDDDFLNLVEKFKEQSELIVYGFTIVRKELRDTSPKKKVFGRNLRVALLSLYDQFVKNHLLIVDEYELRKIAEEYFKVYKELGGAHSFITLEKDYIIVACGSLKQMDIVVSDDNASMLSELSLKAYDLVNQKRGLLTPQFLDYADFKCLVFKSGR